MRRLAAALVPAVLLLAAPARTALAAEDPPTTHAALIIGAGQNVGDLGDRYLYGFLAGTEAGFQIRPTDSFWDLGAAWSFQWGYFPSSSASNVDDVLTIIQLEGVARGRLRLPGPLPFFARAEVGVDLFRASIPIPPDNDQLYLGPTAGVGIEVAVSGWVISLGARYGLFAGTGPTGLRLMFGIGKGSR
jgi:hypothetical protein